MKIPRLAYHDYSSPLNTYKHIGAYSAPWPMMHAPNIRNADQLYIAFPQFHRENIIFIMNNIRENRFWK